MKTNFDPEAKLWSGAKTPYPFPEDVFMGELILKNLQENEDRVIAIFHEEEREITAKEFSEAIIRVAQNLTAIGIGADDVVGIDCMNSFEVCVAINACILIGAPVNPLDVSFTEDDIKHMFGQTKPKLVICDSDVCSKIKNALDELSSEALVITCGKVAGYQSFDELLKPTGHENNFVPPKFPQLPWKRVLAIICSSGTTGLPKGVCTSHGQCLIYINIFLGRPASRSMSFSTTYWFSGFFSVALLALSQSNIQIFSKMRSSVENLMELIRKWKISSHICSPWLLSLLLQSENFINSDHSSLETITCGGAIVSKSLRRKFKEIFPTKTLVVAYGLSEAAVVLPEAMKSEISLSVGSVVLPNFDVKIVDDDEARLGMNEKGEVRVKSIFIFPGYYNNPEATANAFDDEGFFKTGDIGHFDINNHLHLIDRKKDILKYKNYQYNPSEIECVIEEIEGVEMVCVVGVPDPLVTDLPTAVVVKRQGFESLSEDEIIKYVATKLSKRKQLHGGVFFVDRLPLTISGKIQRKSVLEIIKKM